MRVLALLALAGVAEAFAPSPALGLRGSGAAAISTRKAGASRFPPISALGRRLPTPSMRQQGPRAARLWVSVSHHYFHRLRLLESCANFSTHPCGFPRLSFQGAPGPGVPKVTLTPGPGCSLQMGGDKIPDGPAGRGPFDANDSFVLPDGASLPRLIHQPQTATLQRRRVVHIKELEKDDSLPL